MKEPDADAERFPTLMRLAQQGDSDAYAQLLNELTPTLRRVVRRHRGFLGREDVEDLVQDALFSMHRARATYDPGRPFMPWMLAIVRNRLADSARQYARRSAHEVAVEDPAVTFSEPAANTDSGEYRDPDALRQAIQGLPAGQRTAIELLKLQEMSLKDAATATGTSVGALKVATHRAMAALRRKLRSL